MPAFSSGLITAAFKLKRKALENTFKVGSSAADTNSEFNYEYSDCSSLVTATQFIDWLCRKYILIVQDDLEELYAGNNNNTRVKNKNVNNNNDGIIVSSV